jgi:hypothetical protein
MGGPFGVGRSRSLKKGFYVTALPGTEPLLFTLDSRTDNQYASF